MDVVDALFVEPNPTPVKQAVEWLGLPAGPLRPPLERLTPAGQQVLRAAMVAGGWLTYASPGCRAPSQPHALALPTASCVQGRSPPFSRATVTTVAGPA